jgi:acetyltransferase-like isoleucine patch superfamily enzyme
MPPLIYRLYFFFKKKADSWQKKTFENRFKQLGTNVRIEHTCKIFVPENFAIGDNTSISHYTTIYATYGVTIGCNCLISSNCGISSYNHVQESVNRYQDISLDKNYSKPVIIGNNVWIGMNSCILPGISIGNNSIIGSGSVVTKNVPDNEIWVGNPAKFIKKLNCK